MRKPELFPFLPDRQRHAAFPFPLSVDDDLDDMDEPDDEDWDEEDEEDEDGDDEEEEPGWQVSSTKAVA